MPAVNPSSSKQIPADWRWAWNAFQEFKSLASRSGVNTATWSLEYPSRAQRIFDPRWRMRYTIPPIPNHDVNRDVYLGSSGRVAADTIKMIAKDYVPLANSHKEKLVQRKKMDEAAKRKTRPDPMFDPSKVREAFARWNREMKSIRSNRDMQKYLERNPNLDRLMRRKAGILDMTLSEYLTRHPHSELYPTPPRSEEELKKRAEAVRRYAEDKARWAKEDPPWEQNVTWH